MIGDLTSTEIEDLLLNETLGRIGCHADGLTIIVPVAYAYDGTRVVCHSSLGQKVTMMRRNPVVCFEVEQVEDLSRWKSVVAQGHYRELHGEEAAVAMSLLVSRLLPAFQSLDPRHQVASITPQREMPAVVFAIELTEKTGKFESR